jgi:hypothetical protein
MDTTALGRHGRPGCPNCPWWNAGSSSCVVTNGERLADATKAKIPNLMSILFNHAIRYEWLEQGRNPITLVRQSAQRKRTPEILEPAEIQNLLLQLNSCFRLMVLLDVTTALRRSELLALQWCDVDFSTLELNVVRFDLFSVWSETAKQKRRENLFHSMFMWPPPRPHRQQGQKAIFPRFGKHASQGALGQDEHETSTTPPQHLR